MSKRFQLLSASRAWRRWIASAALALLALRLVWVPLTQPGWLAFDDLIPLMHFRQVIDFLTQTWNDYYQWPEVRGRYSLLGTPFRYVTLIPWGLLLGSLLTGLGAFRLAAYVQRVLNLGNSVWGPLVAGTFYLLVIFASKAHQLHTLFLGAALLPWTLLAFLKVLEAHTIWVQVRRGVVSALLLMLNPAIHLVILGYGALTVLALAALFNRSMRKQALIAWVLVTVLGLGPYAMWLRMTGPGLTTAATASVPPSLLDAWSGPFWHRLVLPLGLSLSETYRTGTYTFVDELFAQYAQSWGFILYPVLALLGLTVPLVYRHTQRRELALGFGLIWLGGVFMATGTEHMLSGYRLLLALTEGPSILSILAQVVLAVLRNPDRWLIPASLALALLASFGVTVLTRRAIALSVLIVVLALSPFVVHPAFRPLFSGNLGGVLQPVLLPGAYRQALRIIDGQKTLYLPLMGSRPLRWNLSKKTQDEALILLHGGPSIEGVTGGPLLNQLYVGYAYYEGLYEGRMLQNLGDYLALAGIRYVFFHNDVEALQGVTLPGEFTRLLKGLKAQPELRLVYQQDDVWLFENTRWRPTQPEPLEAVVAFGGSLDELVQLLTAGLDPQAFGLLYVGEGDLNWATFQRWAKMLNSRLLVYIPLTGHEEDFLLSLLASDENNWGAVVYPELGWSKDAQRWWDHRWLNISVSNFPKFKERYGQFGVEGAQNYKLAATIEANATLTLELPVEAPGGYQLFLRALAPEGARLHVELNGELYARELVLEPSSQYRFWEVERLQLRPGRYLLTIQTLTNAPIVINLVYLIAERVLMEQQTRWQELQKQFARANALDELIRWVKRIRTTPKGSLDLRGLYGPLYWHQRTLQGTVPQRSWLVGHLYALPLETATR